jgi:hypothetical protein
MMLLGRIFEFYDIFENKLNRFTARLKSENGAIAWWNDIVAIMKETYMSQFLNLVYEAKDAIDSMIKILIPPKDDENMWVWDGSSSNHAPIDMFCNEVKLMDTMYVSKLNMLINTITQKASQYEEQARTEKYLKDDDSFTTPTTNFIAVEESDFERSSLSFDEFFYAVKLLHRASMVATNFVNADAKKQAVNDMVQMFKLRSNCLTKHVLIRLNPFESKLEKTSS